MNNKANIFFYDFPIGIVGIAEQDGYICRVFFGKDNIPSTYTELETPTLQKAATQLHEYFGGTRKEFNLPLSHGGTPFQQSVWKALQNIPYGKTKSYLDISLEISNPKAYRAVGMANNRNPLAIFIPCHRVTNHNGNLCGYAGGIDTKKFLLNLEGVKPKGEK